MINWIRRLNIYKNLSPMARAFFWVVSFVILLNLLVIPAFMLVTHTSFRQVEHADVKNKLQIGKNIIRQEINKIKTITEDYASWDATYEFVDTQDSSFLTENLTDYGLMNLNLNYIAILDTDGNVVYTKFVSHRNNNIRLIDFDTNSLIKAYPELTLQIAGTIEGVNGLLLQDGKLLMISALPILTSQHLGPSRGVFIFGRLLDAKEEQYLSNIAHFPLFIQRMGDRITSSEMELAKYALTGKAASPSVNLNPGSCRLCHPLTRGSPALAATNPIFVSPFTKVDLGGYTLLYDLHKIPIAVMGIHVPRDIDKLENRSSVMFLIFYSGLLILLGIIGTNILAKTISTEQALDHEYNLLRAVIDNVPEQIFAHDVNGKYLLNNLYDAQMMGINDPEDLQGKSDFDFYPPELASSFQESEKQVIRSGQAIVDVEDVITRSNGEQHWILTTKTPMRDSQGQITGIVGVTRDITERKQRERELEVIVTMSHALRSAETSTNLLVMIYNQIINLLHVDFGTLELIDQASGDAEVVYSYGTEGQLDGKRFASDQGLNSYIRASKKPYLDNNITENPMALDFLVSTGCNAVAGAPMIAEEELIGFLWVGRKSAITEDELHILSAIADIAASSIRRITLHELTEKRLQQLISLRKIDTSINSSKELDATLGVLLDQTHLQLQVDAADVFLFSKDNDVASLHFELGKGFTSNLFDHPTIHMGDGPAGIAAQTRQMVQIQNLAELGPEHPLVRASQEEGFVSYFAVPLLVRNEIKGVLEVFLRSEFNPDPDWVNFLETLAGQAAIAIEQVQLFDGLQRSNKELMLAYDETIEGWVRALDLRDEETEGHSVRVTRLSTDLAAAMGIEGQELVHIHRGALLHDIGKVGVPDHILLKPDKLTEEEWVIMRRHPQLAMEMLSPIDYLRPALTIPYCHHERWDGSGYPRGLKGEDIPLAARIFSVVDVWDALSSDRPYRKAWAKEDIVKYIKEQAGSQFDPEVVKTFLRMV